MKRVILILFGIIAVFAACDKEDHIFPAYELTITNSEKEIDEIRLTGYFQDGTKSIIGKGSPIDGGYKVRIDNPLPSYYLYKIDNTADFLYAPHFSNSSIMCYNAVYFFDAYKDKRFVGTFSHGNHIIYGEDQEIATETHWVKYIYVTDNVDITGTKNTEWGDPFQAFDLHFKKGWNAYVQIDYRHTSRTGYTQTLFTSDIPVGVKWNLYLSVH